MFFEESNRLNPIVIGELHPYYILETTDFPQITIDISPTGAKYLNYFIERKGEKEIHLLVEVSEERLKLICSGEMSLDIVFKSPERDVFYSCLFNPDGTIEWLYYVLPESINEINPIPPETFIKFDLSLETETLDLKIHSQQRRRILIDIYLNANTLKANLKYWSIKSFLIPFTELVKTTILNYNNRYSPKTIEQALSFGYNRIKISSLRTTLEFNYNPDLFNNSRELDNLINLYLLFNAESEEEIIKYFEGFANKRIIPEYLKILRIILKNEASLDTRIAAPNSFYNAAFFDRDRAARLKKLITEKIPFTEYEVEVRGTLVGLELKNQKSPTFTVSDAIEDATYHGKICPDLHSRISEHDFKFLAKEYTFKIKTKYTPETPKNPEKYEHTLLDILV
jgi:hypothetical protein